MRPGRIEHAEEISAADLADLARCEASLQHGIDDGVVEADVLTLPHLVRALADSAAALSTGPASAVDATFGSATGVCVLPNIRIPLRSTSAAATTSA